MRNDLSIVTIAGTEAKARAMAAILESAGIEAVISKDTVLPVLSDLSVPFHGIYVLVPRDRVEEAKHALIDTETQVDDSRYLHDSKNIIFRCPCCGKITHFRLEMAGKTGNCLHCREELKIPEV